MNDQNQNWDEDRMAELLRAARQPAIPPDEEFLARLRAESTKAFQSSSSATPPSRKSKMFMLAWRALAATSAAAVLVAAWFMASDSGGAVTLATLLEKAETAKSLHFRVEQAKPPAGKPAARTVEAWSTAGGKLRLNHPDGTYDIALDEKLWQIDEKANRATSGPSPYYRNHALDLLSLLDSKGELTAAVRKSLGTLAARPVRESSGGREYDVYRFPIPDGRWPWVVEAKVDPATQLLHSLETLVDRDGKRTPEVTLTVLSAESAGR